MVNLLGDRKPRKFVPTQSGPDFTSFNELDRARGAEGAGVIAPDARPNEITLTRRVTGPHQRVRYKQVNHTARAIVCHPIFAERKYWYTRTFSSAI